MTTSKTLKIPFNMDVVANGAPLTSAIYSNCDGLREDLLDQFFFPQTQQEAMPYYVFKEKEVQGICKASEAVYGALVDSLELLFDKYADKIPEYYGAEFINEYPEFVEYAKHTYKNNHEAIYGRFDVAYDFENGKVLGFYENNGDTPVMLFESCYMQDWFAQQAGSPEQQSNVWLENLQRYIGKVTKYKNNPKIGILSAMGAIEDSLTSEYLYWALNEHADCYLYDFEDLYYDFTHKHQPFHVGDVDFDFIFALQPWEEMVVASPDIIAEWREWGDNVQFLEPAWRWFISNKGSLAWIWWLMNHSGETEFIEEHKEALNYLLPTYLTANGMKDYVTKPLIGRLSNNIQVFKDNEMVYSTEGFYEEMQVVYQAYCEPQSVEGRGRAIVGVWMAPYGVEDLKMEASTICLREFDMHVNDIGSERFIPHIVED